MRSDLDAEEELQSVNKRLEWTGGVSERQFKEIEMIGHFFSCISV